MKSLTIFAIGLFGLISTVSASVSRLGPISWANTTTTASIVTASIVTASVSPAGPTSSVNTTAPTTISRPIPISWPNTTTAASSASTGCGHGGSSASLITTTSTMVSAQPSIYNPTSSNNTNPVNATVQSISWHLYDIQASVNNKTEISHYMFKAIIDPPCSNYTAACHETMHTDDGHLAQVDNAICEDPNGMPFANASIPVTFHFAWRPDVKDTSGQRGNLLVIKSNSPGSAHACPYFPYDACWAQGTYWVPESYIEPTSTGDKYIGPESVYLNGTYCRTGMPDCVWSEYLY